MANRNALNYKHKEDPVELIRQFAEFGQTPEGGIKRLAVSKEDKAARDFLCTWFEQNGFQTLIDPVGNIFGVLELDSSQTDRNSANTSFYCGSHLDSQPHGGQFDGTLGVAIACASALVIQKLIEDQKLHTDFKNFVVACWTSEEGARFQPSLLGSRVFVGNMSIDDAWRCKDAQGISLKEALNDIGYIGSDVPPKPEHYLEVHIEQGTNLENAGVSVGLVSSSWGARKLKLQINGRADHTGPTPMRERKDALLAASRIIVEVNDIAHSSQQELHSSVGRIEVSPNSPNTVSEQSNLWIEFRAANESAMDKAEERLEATKSFISQQTGCRIVQTGREVRSVISFDDHANQTVSDALSKSDIPHLHMTTISGHDALQLQGRCPSTLIFLPSKDGISHSPDEYTSDEDIRCGFKATITAISSLMSQSSDINKKGPAHVECI